MAQKCFVCLTEEATEKVTITKVDNSKTVYVSCGNCWPRHIPQGDVALIETKTLKGNR